jgi:hypothetical protein
MASTIAEMPAATASRAALAHFVSVHGRSASATHLNHLVGLLAKLTNSRAVGGGR